MDVVDVILNIAKLAGTARILIGGVLSYFASLQAQD